MNEFRGSDQRKYKRVRLGLSLVYRQDSSLNVSLRGSGEEHKATMFDLSEGGLAIISNVQIPVSTLLWTRFTLSKTEDKGVSYYGSMELLGEVRYCIAMDNDEYRLGIAFVNIKDKTMADIANFVVTVEGNPEVKSR